MRFLIQIPQLIYGGAEKVLVSFANELAARGHSVEVLEIYEKGYLKPQFDSRVTFHAICSQAYTKKYYMSLQQIRAAHGTEKLAGCAKLAFSKLVGYRRFAEKLAAKHYARQDFDVAINYLEGESPEFLQKHIHAKKYIQWYHTDVAHTDCPEDTDRLISQFARMDAIICVAETARQSFAGRYPQLAGKVHVLYNFFDTDAVLKAAAVPFSFPDGAPVLLSVGRMTAQKQYLRFLDVLARLRDDGIPFRWYVLGTGAQLEEIQRKTEQLGLTERVYLEGLTDNPYRYMKNCDLFVLPSGWEGFPTVTVEAKIVDCPVLATDVSGIREQLVHGETGWIVANDETAIYEGLKHLLLHPELRAKLQSNAGMERICDNGEKYREFMQICGEDNNA
ncbi:MAG: glycosyltransferase [Eubacteriales bacterium]